MTDLWEIHISYHSRTGTMIRAFEREAKLAYLQIVDAKRDKATDTEIALTNGRALITVEEIASVILTPSYDVATTRAAMTHALMQDRQRQELEALFNSTGEGLSKS